MLSTHTQHFLIFEFCSFVAFFAFVSAFLFCIAFFRAFYQRARALSRETHAAIFSLSFVHPDPPPPRPPNLYSSTRDFLSFARINTWEATKNKHTTAGKLLPSAVGLSFIVENEQQQRQQSRDFVVSLGEEVGGCDVLAGSWVAVAP